MEDKMICDKMKISEKMQFFDLWPIHYKCINEVAYNVAIFSNAVTVCMEREYSYILAI